MGIPELTLAIFYAFNALRVGAYMPQSQRVAQVNSGAPTISDTTWSVWLGASASAAAYAPIITPNWALLVVNGLNATVYAVVAALTTLKRHELAARSCRGPA
jgi:hypothetical protein